MEHAEEGLTPTQVAARHVRRLRRLQKLTAAQLAERVTLAGVKWDRATVTKLETGRRQSLSIEELIALAKALDVPLIHLLPQGVDSQATEYTVRFKTAEEMFEFLGALETLQNARKWLPYSLPAEEGSDG
jgi:transcriptional regulator with XRE-family HTH domain